MRTPCWPTLFLMERVLGTIPPPVSPISGVSLARARTTSSGARQTIVQGTGNIGPKSIAALRMTSKLVPDVRVLCATDLSHRSRRAVGRAARLARQLDARLILLHVIDPDEFTLRFADVREQIAQQFTALGFPTRREPEILVRSGNYVEAIATVAREISADVVVLGARGRRPRAPLIGTSAERIVALANRPALIVNLEPHVRYDAVVVAAELSDAFIQVVRVASSLKFLEADSVAIVHGFESPYRGPLYAAGFDSHASRRNMEEWERAARARLQSGLDVAGVESSRFRLVFHHERPLRAIQRVIRSVQPELLIMGTKDRSIFNRVTRSSVAHDALRTVACDILVAAPQGESVMAALDQNIGMRSIDARVPGQPLS